MPRLAELHRCTGCTACAAVCPKGAITMTPDMNGFSHPIVDMGICVDCGLCGTVCPVLTRRFPTHVPQAYAARSGDTPMRLNSSSGGVFSELARVILSGGGAVFGAAYDDQFRVVHICAETEAQLARLRGAKYAQSDLGNTFSLVKRRLQTGQQVLFSGTPCQVGGLKAYLGKEYENLFTVDFVCHGVPSPMAWEKFLEHQGTEGLESVNLRAKESGWSRYRYSHKLTYQDGSVRLISSSESLYMKLFGMDTINRLSCTDCAFKGYARVSDLTLGDFWGIWDIDPEMDDDRGTSVVLVQSDRGRALWESIVPGLTVRNVTLEQSSQENGSMLRSSAASPLRQDILDRLRDGQIASCAELLPKPAPPTLLQNAKRMLRRLLRR